jgi:ferrous iron transport protein B
VEDQAKKVLLIGNPNVGKSLLFSRITGRGVIAANYAGTTMELKVGRFKYKDADYDLFDMPGLYSLEAFSRAEETAIDMIDSGDILINVLDATNLERSLNLTLKLIARRKRMILCLNIWDDTAHKGISIDAPLLGTLLGVPVVTTSALSGAGINDLVAALPRSRVSSFMEGPEVHWSTIGAIIDKVQKLSHRHHTALERLSDFTLSPVTGPLSAVVILAATFLIVRFIGETLVNGICDPIFMKAYDPFVLSLSHRVPWHFLRELLAGHTVDPLQSFGILTTGVYIALVLVFPYFFSFYLLFGLLEDFGYLPRLAVVLDTFVHRLGLHGYSSIPVMLGLGCKVPAFLAARGLASRREKTLTMALILMSAPCLPQSAMIYSLGIHYGMMTVIAIFVILFVWALAMNRVLNKVTKGEMAELFIEIPSYRMPSIRQLSKKLWFRVMDYAREIFPMIAAGVLIINLLDSLHIIALISRVIGKPVTLLLGLPGEIASVMILGFLRKDVSIALLAPFNLSSGQFIVAAIFMVLYIPCIASFFTLIKEAGVRTALKVIGFVFVSAVAVCAVLHLIFIAFAP